jgi:hypothetical protein
LEMAARETEPMSTEVVHGVSRDFALDSQGTPEPGSLGLLGCASLLILRRRGNR